MRFRWQPHYSPDDGKDAGGSTAERVSGSDMIARYDGSTVRMAERLAALENDNYKFHEKNRDLTAENATLKGKVPADGALILAGDDAAAWEQYKALGTASDLKASLEGATTAQMELAGLKREKDVTAFAGTHGLKAPVLLELLKPGEELVSKDVAGADGKPVKQAFIKTADGEAPLLEKYAHFAPALLAEAAKDQPKGLPYPRQSNDGSPPRTAAQQHIGNTKYAVPGKEK